jgi:hypothetical protein
MSPEDAVICRLESEVEFLRASVATLTRERDEARVSLQAMELSRDKRLERARSTIAFFASVIKSGEPWTTSCEEARTAALSEATP